jgi:hypothetical protein
MQTTIQLLYKTISGNKKKERFETILEPLQALIQIALLSYYPIGSKLTIQNNILHIQAPSYSQSVTRWYNNDTQEDLFYLFNIFCRFKKFYTDVKAGHTKLFELLISLAKNGINNLIRTYNQTDKTHVLHTLQMYKNMLDGTNHNNHHVAATPIIIQEKIPANVAAAHSDNHNHNHNHSHDKHKKNKITRPENTSGVSLESVDNDGEKQPKNKEMANFASPEIDMDTIFIKISDLYTDEVFHIIYNALIEMERDETNYMDYANGLNMILHPINIRIKKWIDENIVF